MWKPLMKMTQDELVAEARRRFGDDPQQWAFICPNCGDVAVAGDFPNGERALGQYCTGNFVADRGCDWKAFGLFRGPVEIVMPDGHSSWGFELAPPPTEPDEYEMTEDELTLRSKASGLPRRRGHSGSVLPSP